MTPAIAAIAFPLFVPADRPDRYGKAFGSGADAVTVDLEDAVASDAKDGAREAMRGARNAIAAATCPVIVRVNPEGSAFHAADLGALDGLALAAVMVPKVESAATVRRVAAATGRPVLAMVESARGLAVAREVAGAGARLVFGSFDYAADLGCAHSRDALLSARAELVLASRIANAPAPIDGVTTAIENLDEVRDDAAYAASLGFGGKLLIHPAQVGPAGAGFRPTEDEIAWAARVLAAGREGGATALDGTMVDAPVRLRAEQIERRAGRGRQAVR